MAEGVPEVRDYLPGYNPRIAGDLAPWHEVIQRAFVEPVNVDSGQPTGRIGEAVGRGATVAAVAGELANLTVVADISVALQVLAIGVTHEVATATEYVVRQHNGTNTDTLIANLVASVGMIRWNSLSGPTGASPLSASPIISGNEVAMLGNVLATEHFAAGVTGRRVIDLRPHGFMLYGRPGTRMSVGIWCNVANEALIADFYCREWRLR